MDHDRASRRRPRSSLGVAMSYYHLARPGADLPLQLPEGAVITKARDTVESFGYSGLGSRTSVAFIDAVDVEDITRDGRPGRARARRFGRHAGRVLARGHHAHRQSVRRPRARGRRFLGPPRSRAASSSRLRPATRPTHGSRTPIATRRRRSASRRSRRRSASTRRATSSKSSSAPSPPARRR